ncbi:hypothetical protein [Alloactinosynnema sp. L-07]|uniref:hypothetical protein n=1 Tax=Alloactinosynnema sp. L-07 TaxID=1653480 RepID=UPI00065F07C0|nr:hypothetical protein [Alloactinosynnema sp. L-07]CRK55449.1 hypothetical protein [Alloactinosynnema sp. L-07]
MLIEIPDADVPAIQWVLTTAAAVATRHVIALGSTDAESELGRQRLTAITRLTAELDPDDDLDTIGTDPAH